MNGRAASLVFVWSVWLSCISWARGMREGINLAAPYLEMPDTPFWLFVAFITVVAAAMAAALSKSNAS